MMRETVHVDEMATAWYDRPEGDGRDICALVMSMNADKLERGMGGPIII